MMQGRWVRGKNMHVTQVIHNRYAWRSYRTHAAIDGSQGMVLLTIEQLVARLAGGFRQPIDSDDLKTVVAIAAGQPLGELDAIKELPGFQRAAANSLSKAWAAGLSLQEEADWPRPVTGWTFHVHHGNIGRNSRQGRRFLANRCPLAKRMTPMAWRP